jgi:hypothetical protein
VDQLLPLKSHSKLQEKRMLDDPVKNKQNKKSKLKVVRMKLRTMLPLESMQKNFTKKQNSATWEKIIVVPIQMWMPRRLI